jgi:hypothetical protein
VFGVVRLRRRDGLRTGLLRHANEGVGGRCPSWGLPPVFLMNTNSRLMLMDLVVVTLLFAGLCAACACRR